MCGANRGGRELAWMPYTPHASPNDYWLNAFLADIVSKMCREKFPSTKLQLAQYVMRAGESVPLPYIRRALGAFVPRLKQIMKNDGFVTDDVRSMPIPSVVNVVQHNFPEDNSSGENTTHVSVNQ